MNSYAMTVAQVGRQSQVTRRSFLKWMGAGAAVGLTWQDRLALASDQLRQQGKSMIVLWMQGGPTQFETWDPKGHSQSKAIDTAVPGIQISENFPNAAKLMNDLCIIRSMTNKEGNHQRATYQLHTCYVPSGTLKHPSFGSLVCQQAAPTDQDLPSFVSVLGPSHNAGFLPVNLAPFQVQDPTRMPDNSQIQVPADRFARRLDLLSRLETGYESRGAQSVVKNHQDLVGQTARLIRSPKLEAFDVAREPEKVRAAYGTTPFGQGCLLARRLVEAGVTYVEVQLGNWDTHFDNARRVQGLAAQCDPAMATLIADLKDRGRLDSTLVVWMGEFGRTPKINPKDGRDHFPRAFSAVLAGAGVPGGQVIGTTDETGSAVKDRPVSVQDLFTTFCTRLAIDPTHENHGPLNRPLKVVDGGAAIL
jgi:hypothetical protein